MEYDYQIFSAFAVIKAAKVLELIVRYDRAFGGGFENSFQGNKISYIPFADIHTAIKNDPALSPYFKSLNGIWKFNWVKKPTDRPVDFFQENYDVNGWGVIEVPGNWELQGYGMQIYLDEEYPFPPDPPNIPHNWTPVGSYSREFQLPENWHDREIFLHFAGVRSAMYVWVNGEKVGYSQGSRTPAEFNITKYRREGINKLSVEVYRWSDGSYLEGQDTLRLSGIERDVFLFSPIKLIKGITIPISFNWCSSIK